jgi:hypothetical protein
VGASLLAMVVNDNAGCLDARVAADFFASGLAPAGKAAVIKKTKFWSLPQ